MGSDRTRDRLSFRMFCRDYSVFSVEEIRIFCYLLLPFVVSFYLLLLPPMPTHLTLFQDKTIRRHRDEQAEKRYFSVIDIVSLLTNQSDHKKSKSYRSTLKNRLKNE